jgi:Sec-independent protein translocase protein TatA
MFKEIIQNLGKGNKERKEKYKELDEDVRMHEMVEERKKSSNERELERYMKEEREKKIKEQ